MKYLGKYRINDFAMIKMNHLNSANRDFFYVDSSELLESGVGIQYIDIDRTTRDENNQITNIECDVQNVVWNFGSQLYNRRLNYNLYDGLLYQPLNISENVKFYNVQLFIKQCFSWNGLKGLHVIIKGVDTGNVYVSKLIDASYFVISDEKVKLSGTFWLEYHSLNIPFVEEDLCCQVTQIKYTDIYTTMNSNIGYVYNYPTNFVPIIDSKPYPDFVYTNVTLDENNFLHLSTVTNEYKTLEKSLKDYFGIPENQLSHIQIDYVINYSGIVISSGVEEERSIRVSNESNTYEGVVVGLDLNDWIDYENPNQVFNVVVDTIIEVDNKIMTRNSNFNMDVSTTVISLLNKFDNPTTFKNINVTEVVNVEQVVVNTNKKIKYVNLIQPILVELVSGDFVYDKKYITFDYINAPCQMLLSNQILQSKTSSDSKYYFDLSEMIPISEDMEYKIMDTFSNNVFGSGKITLK